MLIKDLNVGDTIRIPYGIMYLEGEVIGISDLLALVDFPSVGSKFISDESDFKRIRKVRTTLNPNKWLEKAVKENSEKTKSVLESGLGISKPQTEYNQSNDLQQRKRGELNISVGMKTVPSDTRDTVNHPSHYNYGEIEVIDFIEQVTQHYNPNVAYHIGNAIKYIARSPHKNGKEDIQKAKWYIERAFKVWED